MKKFLLPALLLLFTVACMAQVDVNQIPKWYNEPPKSIWKIYASGTATAPTVEIAEKKATIDAKVQLARKVGSVEYKRKNKEVIASEVVKAELRDVKVERKMTISNQKMHTVFVLVSMKKKHLKKAKI
ncbi:hypothetical protein [Tenuifilum thalassicum]|uniref:LPP20 lipoprotein n=1 Tax=Tenuifilum thalassicum TaxID=2590900 RepID=A0A7D4C170_9BACT|nr:hypothetical protein [Tenuifilum thalassicum]QKG80544.1 hypothetical protein FHG85_09770 [Tenuifilum thalassicum]